MTAPASLAALVSAACADLVALADADADVVRAISRGASVGGDIGPEIERARHALNRLSAAWAAVPIPADVTPPPWPRIGEWVLSPMAYARALHLRAGIGHARSYADALAAWWREAGRCFEATTEEAPAGA